MARESTSRRAKAPSKHSRAARRAASPGIDTDKSLKSVRPPAESANQRPAVLAAHHGGGVTKKKSGGAAAAKSGRKAVLSTRAKRRLERSADRAEAVADRGAEKVRASVAQLGTIRSRKRTWDEVNKGAAGGGGGGRAGGGGGARKVAGGISSTAGGGIASATVFGLLEVEADGEGGDDGDDDDDNKKVEEGVGESEGKKAEAGGTGEEGGDEQMTEATGADGNDADGQRVSVPAPRSEMPLPLDGEDEIL